jgi:chitodextrinase
MSPSRRALAATAAAFLFALLPAMAASPAVAALPADTRAPTKPHHLHVTAVTPYSVSLAWNASSDNSGSFSYVILSSHGYFMTVPQTSTSATFANAVFPLNTYSFVVYAVDAAGNRSANSNSDSATLPADTTIPGVPSVTVTDIGPHHASFSWSSTDNDPYLSYFVYINGVQAGFSTTATTGTFYLPQASTSYTITVRARDHAINFSPTSAPVVFSTDAVDPNDTQPPTTPAGLDVFHYPSDRELVLTWGQSTDNVDAQQAIHYEIYINGVLAEHVIGVGSTISYGEFGSNLISIVAIDSAGNESGTVFVTTEI